jgi:hypothetical protein
MKRTHRQLRQVVQRDIQTHYTVSEVLECGHRFESLTLLGDPLTAKRRVCPACEQLIALPPKKPAQPAVRRIPSWRQAA